MPRIPEPAGLLPEISRPLLQARLESLRQSLGAHRLGLGRRLLPHGTGPVPFQVLGAVQREGASAPAERAFPPAAYLRLLGQGHPFRVDGEDQGALGAWLRRHGGGELRGWAEPGDRLPCILFVAWVPRGWEPGPLRWRVIRAGMEVMARRLAPPSWLLGGAGDGPAATPEHDGAHCWQPAAGGSLPAEAGEDLGEPLPPLEEALVHLEVQLLRQALRRCRGNKADAARALHLSRQSLYRRMRRHGLEGDSRQGEGGSL
jgi:hypothetical protein